MSFTGHLLPLAVTLLIWFLSTGLIAWLGNCPRAGFGRSLVVGGAMGVTGLVAIILTANDGGILAAYVSFAGALAVWGWLELAFLTGAVTGPRRTPAPAGLTGRRRFQAAAATVIHHELTLAAGALVLLSVSWGAVNPTGAAAFALLLVLRLSTKLNIFLGVPNFSDELLPPQLAHLRGYFGPPRLRWSLIVSLMAAVVLAGWIGVQALAAPTASGAAVGLSLLFGLAALGVVEHLFLALPVKDGALWRWALPNRPDHVRT